MSEVETFDNTSLSQFLSVYYRRIFPSYIFSKWLAYGEPGLSQTFKNREFSFTVENDVYIRYLSFSNHLELEREMIRLCPFKIDIGAVYSLEPKAQQLIRAGSSQPVERELIFDIDLSDYDDVRYCCREGNVCSHCWPLMRIAIKILDHSLREDFGFNRLLWVFSGRRGVHCWVCDQAARRLSNRARESIIDYLSVVKSGSGGWCKRVFLQNPLHPFLQHAAEIIKDAFEDYACVHQDFLSTDEGIERILMLCPADHRNPIREKWKSVSSDSLSRWNALCQHFSSTVKGRGGPGHAWSRNNLSLVPTEIMFQFCYPRMDSHVSKSMNHLLKAPFCVHPKTGKLSVPMIDVETFSVDDVPTVLDLIQDLNSASSNSPSKPSSQVKATKEFRRTRLRQYVEYFDAFVRTNISKIKSQNQTLNDLQAVMDCDF